MPDDSARLPPPAPEVAELQGKGITTAETLLFAGAVGLIITNLFAAQPLTGLIGPSLGLSGGEAGLVSMVTLLGYACGLFFLVPLADLVENRRLIVRTLSGAVLAAAACAWAPNAAVFLGTAFVLGVACSAIQMLVPIAAAMAPVEKRGRVIGDVMSGVMVGILLSRPLASLIAEVFDWRAFYGMTAVLMAVLTAVLARLLPRRHPAHQARYLPLIASLWQLLRTEPVLRRCAFTAALTMAAFSLFWTAVALRLAAAPFGLDQGGIALFALFGAGGIVAAPLAGRAGDRGWSRGTRLIGYLAILVAMALAELGGAVRDGSGTVGLILLALAALVLDLGVSAEQTVGRRAINLLRPEARGRINGIFVGIFFLGGAVGSALAGVAWTFGSWTLVCALGAVLGLAALAIDVTARQRL